MKLVIWWLLFVTTLAIILFGPALVCWHRELKWRRSLKRNLVVTYARADGIIRAEDISVGCELVVNDEPRIPPTIVANGDRIAIRYIASRPLPTAVTYEER
jgi:hypothetical protein